MTQSIESQILQNILNVLHGLYSIVFKHKNSSNEPENSSTEQKISSNVRIISGLV